MLPRTHAPLTYPFLVAASATTFATLYAVLNIEPAGLPGLYIRYGSVVSLICWAVADLRGTALAGIYDWGLFHFLAWPVLGPWYLRQRYGKRAWPLFALFAGLWLGPLVPFGIAALVRASP